MGKLDELNDEFGGLVVKLEDELGKLDKLQDELGKFDELKDDLGELLSWRMSWMSC